MKKNLQIIKIIRCLLVIVLSLTLFGCLSPKKMTLTSNFYPKIKKANVLQNRHIIFDEYFDPWLGQYKAGKQTNPVKIWELWVHSKKKWKKKVTSIPNKIKGAKIGSFQAYLNAKLYSYDPDSRSLDITTEIKGGVVPVKNEFLAEQLIGLLTKKKAKVKTSKLGNGDVYYIVATKYVDDKGKEITRKKAEKLKADLIQDQYWVDAENGQLLKYAQLLNKKLYYGFKLLKISQVDKIPNKVFSVSVPKGTMRQTRKFNRSEKPN